MGGNQSTTDANNNNNNNKSNSTSPVSSPRQPQPSTPSIGGVSKGIQGGGGGGGGMPIPKSSASSGAHRDALEVIMSPPSSPTHSRVLYGMSPGGGGGVGGGGGGGVGLGMPGSNPELIPTVFTWTGGGKNVYITGTFNDWKEKIPLNLSDKDFTLIRNLPPGIHQYKFVVDGKWVHAQDQPISTDIKGNINNFVDVKALNRTEGLSLSPPKLGGSTVAGSPPGEYSTIIPEDINSSPLCTPPSTPSNSTSPTRNSTRASAVPGLPPHLQRALLNTTPPSDEDPSLLPLPHHVMLNHLYILPKEDDDVTILGVTHRYRTKFVTTVLYKPFVGAKSTDDEYTVEIEL